MIAGAAPRIDIRLALAFAGGVRRNGAGIKG